VPSTSVSYNAANQITAATFPAGPQTWVYNSLLQMTQQTINGKAIQYLYTAGADNGQVASIQDAVSGETITYQYDSLKRLQSATSTTNSTTNWTENYAYDGFGNMTNMTGTGGAPSLSVATNWRNNQITGVLYANYGNVSQFAGNNLGYDVANRLVTVNGAQVYAYDQVNRRVYSNTGGEKIYLYGAGGTKAATYAISVTNTAISFTLQSENVYFAGRLISAESNAVAVDALGSVRSSNTGNHSYYPYGVEYSGTANDTEKYATYTRDNLTGLDYAMNRYYSSQWGRFLLPDPYVNSAGLGDPGSWNRYAYVRNDPVNRLDPAGRWDCVVGEGEYAETTDCEEFDVPGVPGMPTTGHPSPPATTEFPDCNPKFDPVVENKLNFIVANYATALAEANVIAKDVASPIDTVSLAAMFVAWSARESYYGMFPQNIAENNYFGAQDPPNKAGWWNGTTVTCVRDNNPIPVNSQNACFPPGMTWGQELSAILGSTSGKTGLSYLDALEGGLKSNPTEGAAAALQSIAANGFNVNANYGTDIMNNKNWNSLLNCLKSEGDIK
jgi:RHS repeat-associated protein